MTTESICEYLCNSAEKIKSPSRHRKILEQREEQIQSDKAGFINWESAKKNIRRKINL